MKHIFTLLASIVLAASLLAVPCFAVEPEDLPTPQLSVSETEHLDSSEQLNSLNGSGIQLYDVLPADGRLT